MLMMSNLLIKCSNWSSASPFVRTSASCCFVRPNDKQIRPSSSLPFLALIKYLSIPTCLVQRMLDRIESHTQCTLIITEKSHRWLDLYSQLLSRLCLTRVFPLYLELMPLVLTLHYFWKPPFVSDFAKEQNFPIQRYNGLMLIFCLVGTRSNQHQYRLLHPFHLIS